MKTFLIIYMVATTHVVQREPIEIGNASFASITECERARDDLQQSVAILPDPYIGMVGRCEIRNGPDGQSFNWWDLP